MNNLHSKPIFSKLVKKPAALFGIAVIGLTLIVALFAYVLAPDGSTNANRMVPEIANKRPGFDIDLLRIKKQNNLASTGWFSTMINGKEEPYQYLPVKTHSIANDSLRATRYIDDGVYETVVLPIHALADVPVQHYKFYLGTDSFGRDILSRLIVGTRVSLGVGMIAVVISLLFGITLGSIAGYFGGRWDGLVMWLVNVLWSIPTLLLVFALTLLIGKGVWQVFIAVGLTMWVNVARIVRGQVMAVKEFEFVEATRVLGFSHSRRLVYHILPNIMGPILVIAASNFASAIIIEAGLSFLGVGVQPPQPGWGLMIKENYNFLLTNNPMLAIIPGLAIMLLVLAFNLLGAALRDAFDVK